MLGEPRLDFTQQIKVWFKETDEIGAILHEVLAVKDDGIVLLCCCHSCMQDLRCYAH